MAWSQKRQFLREVEEIAKKFEQGFMHNSIFKAKLTKAANRWIEANKRNTDYERWKDAQAWAK